MPEDAWAVLKKASDERDLEDFREVGREDKQPTAADFNRASKSTPRRFPRLLLWTSKRKCVRRTSAFTSSLWLVLGTTGQGHMADSK